MSTEISVPQGGELVYQEERTYMPVMQVAQAIAMYEQFKAFVKGALHEGQDYGTIPGTNKPTLYKAGAEKCCKFFGLSVGFTLVDKVEDWTGEHHGGMPMFHYTYKSQLFRNGIQVAECEGSANTWEDRYRYRNTARKCPKCGATAISKGREEYGGGFYCNKKAGGCGAKFLDTDKSITSQQAGKVINTEPFTIINTVQKQAQKRAFVGASLIACNASDYFTQDIEDTSVQEAEVVDEPPYEEPHKQEAHAQTSTTIKKLIAAFLDKGIQLKSLENYIGRPADEWQSPEIEIMRTCYKLLKSGEKTADELFAQKADTDDDGI